MSACFRSVLRPAQLRSKDKEIYLIKILQSVVSSTDWRLEITILTNILQQYDSNMAFDGSLISSPYCRGRRFVYRLPQLSPIITVQALNLGLQDQIWIISGTFGGVVLIIAVTVVIMILKVARFEKIK